MSEPVSVRARFERFPATVKGAFVIRGEDPDPHQVAFREARIVPVAGRGPEHEIAMKEAVLDAPPHQDVFLPFEFSIVELEPGWYGLECDLEVDGVHQTFPGGRRFVVQWPRAAVRRGTIRVGNELSLGGVSVSLEQLECTGDQVALRYEVSPPEPVTLRLVADGARLGELDVDFDEESGQGKLTAYPLLRSQSKLRIEAARGRDAEGAVDVDLP